MRPGFRLTATWGLAALTALALVVILLGGLGEEAALALGFIPARVTTPVPWPAVPVWLTPLSATLVHAGIWHLAMNLLLLAWCGREVERVLGPGPLVLIYVAGAYFAAAGEYLIDPAAASPMVGASGAISALVGAYAMSFGRPKPLVRNFRLNRALNTLWIMVAWVVLQAMSAFLMEMQGVMLATGAHIGGFLAGVLLHRPLLLWRYRRA